MVLTLERSEKREWSENPDSELSEGDVGATSIGSCPSADLWGEWRCKEWANLAARSVEGDMVVSLMFWRRRRRARVLEIVGVVDSDSGRRAGARTRMYRRWVRAREMSGPWASIPEEGE